jgi:AcrR family transcriptional regulator
MARLGEIAPEPGSPPRRTRRSPVRSVSRAAEATSPKAVPDWHSRVLERSLGPASDKALRQGRDLIAAAGRLMRRLDPDEMTMQSIAAEARVSVRVLYRHFEGKNDLLIALIEESQIVLARLLHERTADVDDALERLGEALYFASDPRHHSDPQYNRALARFTAQTWVSDPDRVGSAHRPVFVVISRLVADAVEAGQLEAGDPDIAASNIYMSYRFHQMNRYIGNALGGPLPSPRQFVRYCLLGLGAQLPEGWEDRLGRDTQSRTRSGSEKAAKQESLTP